MILHLHKTEPEALTQITPSQISTVFIEIAISNEKLTFLKQFLVENDRINIVLTVDPDAVKKSGWSHNLQIVAGLENVRHLTILCFSSSVLEDLDELKGIRSLVSFKLAGAYNKKIDLGPLQESKGIETLELEYGLADKRQVTFVNGLEKLKKLTVSVLDAGLMQHNPHLSEIKVNNTLKNADQLARVYPNLETFGISYAKGLDNLDFLGAFKHLTSLSIGYIKKLNRLPAIFSSENMSTLTLINTPDFNDMEGILKCRNLESLCISGFSGIPFHQFLQLEGLEKLKRVHLGFKEEAENRRFEELAGRKGWVSNML